MVIRPARTSQMRNLHQKLNEPITVHFKKAHDLNTNVTYTQLSRFTLCKTITLLENSIPESQPRP